MWNPVFFVVSFLSCSFLSHSSEDSEEHHQDYITLPMVDINITQNLKMIPKSRKLFCYQCTADSRDELPICDETFWSLTTEIERRQFLVECPEERDEFCIKKLVHSPIFVHTARGCNGLQDDMGLPLRIGCSMYGSQISSTVCICDTSRCNSAYFLTVDLKILGFLISVIARTYSGVSLIL